MTVETQEWDYFRKYQHSFEFIQKSQKYAEVLTKASVMLVLASSLREFDISCKECYVYLEALMGKCILSFQSLFVSGKIVRQDERWIMQRDVY